MHYIPEIDVNTIELIFSLPELKIKNQKKYNAEVVSLVNEFKGDYSFIFTKAMESKLYSTASTLAELEPQRLSANILKKAICRDYSQKKGAAFYNPESLKCLLETGLLKDINMIDTIYHLSGKSQSDLSNIFNFFYACEEKGVALPDSLYERFIKSNKHDIYDTLLMIGKYRKSPDEIKTIINNTMNHFVEYLAYENWCQNDVCNIKAEHIKKDMFTFIVDNNIIDLERVKQQRYQNYYHDVFLNYVAAHIIENKQDSLVFTQQDKTIIIENMLNFPVFVNIIKPYLKNKEVIQLNKTVDYKTFINNIYEGMNKPSKGYNRKQLEDVFSLLLNTPEKQKQFYSTKSSQNALRIEELLNKSENKNFYPHGINSALSEFLKEQISVYQQQQLNSLIDVNPQKAEKTLSRI